MEAITLSGESKVRKIAGNICSMNHIHLIKKSTEEECESGLDRELGYARQLLYVLNVQKLT